MTAYCSAASATLRAIGAARVEARRVGHAAVERHRAVRRLEADRRRRPRRDAARCRRRRCPARGRRCPSRPRRPIPTTSRRERARGRAGCGRPGGPGVWPIIPQASCVIASLPIEIAPAASSRSTTVALAVAARRVRAPRGPARRVQAGDVEAVLPARTRVPPAGRRPRRGRSRTPARARARAPVRRRAPTRRRDARARRRARARARPAP